LEEEKRLREERKVKFRPNTLGNRKQTVIWILSITTASFFISAFLTFVSSVVSNDLTIVIVFPVLLIITLANLCSDILGTAVTAADEAPFHAMASRKIFGARRSIMLIRNADKVSNLCNDVIGDICGIISGVIVAYIAIRISGNLTGNANRSIIGIILTGLLTAVVVGGKAFTKNVAIKHSNYIVYKCSEFLEVFSKVLHFPRKKKSVKTKDGE